MKENLNEQLAKARLRMDRLREARQTLTDEVTELMAHDVEEQLEWKGSKVDLMEALYYVFEDGMVTDDNGVPMAFRSIVARCCEVLHITVPCNPYEMAHRGRERKGVKHRNFMDRYLLTAQEDSGKGLWKHIVQHTE